MAQMADHEELSPSGVRISWQAISLFGALVIAAITGMIAIGSNSRQIENNTTTLAEMRIKVDQIESGGSPQFQELKTRVSRIDAAVNNLPVVDANITGRLEVIQSDIRRLDDLAVKKNQEWPAEIQRVAKLEALLMELDIRVRNIRTDLNGHSTRAYDDLRDQIKALQAHLDTERAAHLLLPEQPARPSPR